MNKIKINFAPVKGYWDTMSQKPYFRLNKENGGKKWKLGS